MEKIKNEFLLSIDKFPVDQQAIILQAYEFSELIHHGQHRKTGEEYFIHPLSVANFLAQRNFDYVTIASALLHDVLEDGNTNYLEIEKIFGHEIAKIVDGVTKISNVPIRNKPLFFDPENYFSERVDNYRKLLVSSANDIRVIIIKLYDRLHNIETIFGIKGNKKRFYAIETIEIYAQIAERIGFGEIKRKLEDLSFPHAYPEEYALFLNIIKSLPAIDNNFIDQKALEIKNVLQQNGLKKFEIQTRVKHQYSIFKKLRDTYNFNFDKFHDLYGARIILNTVEECYIALGLINTTYQPVIERIYDMISHPKENGYQSIHTTMFDITNNKEFEIQIRTYDMHQIAEFGPAAHWHYKESSNGSKHTISKGQKEWLGEIQQISKLNSNRDFINFIKSDLFSTKIFVFTPNGDIFNLPKGSSVIDFAFRVHSRLGEKCSGAKINNSIVNLSTKLQNGDTVEILTTQRAKPSIDWLVFCKTSYARNKIKHYLRKADRERLINTGYKILSELKTRHNLPTISEKKANELLLSSRLPYNHINDLMVALANRIVTKNTVIKTLFPDFKITIGKKQHALSNDQSSLILPGIRYSIAKCCNPDPSQKIVGYIGKDHIIKIHKKNCKFLKNSDPSRLIYIDPFDSHNSIV